jgi:PhzF family phenazine biosynthesis protein
MKKIKMYQVDAFTDKLFSGNPAAVCILDNWLSDEKMQLVAAENNLAETAFIVPKDSGFGIRWFTPTVEVDLCGHATLAGAYVLFNCLGYNKPEIEFYSLKNGLLKVSRQDDTLFLDFPSDRLSTCTDKSQINACINVVPVEVYKGKTDYLVLVKTEAEVKNLLPDLTEISKLAARGLIVTAKGENVDFVSRFFAPQSGVNEDPVTGSAHTSLIPFWAEKTGKKEMSAMQLSDRGGKLICISKGERCLIGGTARLYLTGEISLD